ncbi:flavin reductase (NADPH) [Daphnia magna]|uniref:Flavin reductase (NADPH) n=2 Tax=Daphnia magna TaxID=35525 RepID=A0A0P6GDC1_9CRUS|nr:flavin reductase (NADPH) [Daphnia magna]KAK4036371.1 hypothetical protein OUZ56_028430 [Daphnia magna]KZS15994.1 Flavin reductase (NADPH) [Daphnia magna]
MTKVIEKVVIFGATGQTGLCCIEQALKKGIKVTALVRDLSRLPDEVAPKINVINGNSTIKEDVAKALEGQDAVIVTLGTRNDLNFTTVMSDSLKLILDLMCETGIKAISACMSSFLFMDPERVPPRFAEINADHKRMLETLQSPKYESLDWIAVLPPHIADEPSSNNQFKVNHGSSPGRQVPKSDLGQFMVECLSQPEHYHQLCGLAYPTLQ